MTTNIIRHNMLSRLALVVVLILSPSRVLGDPPTMTVERPIAPLPRGITSFGAARHGNWLYVVGGHWGPRHEYSADTYEAGFRRLNLLEPTSWEELPGGAAVQSVALVAHDRFLYRVGGATARNGRGEENDVVSLDVVKRYDVKAAEWDAMPPLPAPRSSHDAVVLDGRLYVVGGWRLSGKESEPEWHDTAWVMDLAAAEPAWQPLAQPPFKRRAMGLAAVRGKLFVIGGMEPDGETTTRVDIYDVRARKWSRGPDYPKGEFHAIMACAVGDYVYANGLDGMVNRLRHDGAAWEPLTKLEYPRFFHRLVPASEHELLAIGGASRSGKIREIESITLRPRPGP